MDRHERLRAARERHFPTAKAAAESLGVPYGTYSGHEAGSRGFKSDELALYARRFHVSQAWLAFGEGEVGDGVTEAEGRDHAQHLGTASGLSTTRMSPKPDKTYIQIEIGVLRDFVSGVFQNEGISEEQADAYAAAVLGSLAEHASASLVLRLEDTFHSEPGSTKPGPDDRS